MATCLLALYLNQRRNIFPNLLNRAAVRNKTDFFSCTTQNETSKLKVLELHKQMSKSLVATNGTPLSKSKINYLKTVKQDELKFRKIS